MPAYYNEIDERAAAWLRELIAAQLLPAGDVDTRSIEDVTPNDIRGYTQCHFFAGIGGWPAALKWLVGWPDDRPVWTGSCPCQPFSNAGKKGGTSDKRHLWPAWFHLVEALRPGVVFGEQVASPDGLGWLDLVQADMEGTGYTFGAADLCAAGVGSPTIRQRLFFGARRMAHPHDPGSQGREVRGHGAGERPSGAAGMALGLADAHGAVPQLSPGAGAGPDEAPGTGPHGEPHGRGELRPRHGPAGPPHLFWRAQDWLLCRDGRWRPVESGTFPLADGVPDRVGLLRGYGNAIVPQVAAEFVMAFEEDAA